MLGVADRELEHVLEPPRAEVAQEQQPAAERPGDARGENARARDELDGRASRKRSIVAAAGETPCAQRTSGSPRSALQKTAGRSPPGPFRCGSTTWRVKPAATAASKAFPPRSSTAIPAAEASQWVEATIPKVPRSSGLVVKAVTTREPYAALD